MSWRGETEDGLGWGGLVPTKAEREEERRESARKAEIAALRARLAGSERESRLLSDRHAGDVRALAQALSDQRQRAEAADATTARLLAALEVARDIVHGHVLGLREAYRGYPKRYANEEADLAQIDAAIASAKDKQ